MKKREASFGILLRHWLKANPEFETSAFELKQTTEDYISFDCFEPGQVDWLQTIKSNKGVLVRTRGGGGEPDYIWMKEDYAYIVIRFPKCFTIIDIDDFLNEQKISERKSLTSERAIEISLLHVQT